MKYENMVNLKFLLISYILYEIEADICGSYMKRFHKTSDINLTETQDTIITFFVYHSCTIDPEQNR